MPTKRDKIEKWSLTYHLLKYYVDFCFKFYFRTTVSGLANIPKDKSIILAPNHQNALMDALAILSVKSWQLVFLARADIFEKPFYNKLLTLIKILPVYRMRDGYGNLQKNDEVFIKTMDVLSNKIGVGIMPEGNHGDKKRLRPLKKGIARIAFQSEDASDGTLDIHIVPVGLDYSDYIKVGSKLHIRFGMPFRVKPLLGLYRENPAKGYNQLLELLEKSLKTEMIDIEDERYYNGYKVIIDMFTKQYLKQSKIYKSHPNRVDAQILMIQKIDELKKRNCDDFLLLIANALEYNMLINKMALDPNSFPADITKRMMLIPHFIFLAAALPLFIYSFINCMLPLSLPYFLTKKIKDKQFISSFRFGVGILVFPAFHAMQILVFSLVTKNLLYTAIYAVSLPLSVYLFFVLSKSMRIYFRRLREVIHSIFNSKKVKRAKELHKAISKKMWDEINRKSDEDYMPSYMDD
jgi:1-acyl-sn-glycerol-3-phosphate acyltransferase